MSSPSSVLQDLENRQFRILHDVEVLKERVNLLQAHTSVRLEKALKPPTAVHPADFFELLWPQCNAALGNKGKRTEQVNRKTKWDLTKKVIVCFCKSALHWAKEHHERRVVLPAAIVPYNLRIRTSASDGAPVKGDVVSVSSSSSSTPSSPTSSFTFASVSASPSALVSASSPVPPEEDSQAVEVPQSPLSTTDYSAGSLLAHAIAIVSGVVMTPEQGAHAIKEGDELKKLLDSTNNKTSKEMLRESYVPGVNNISWSEKVLQVSSEFKQESERDWFEKGIDPFAHFKFCVDPRSLHEMPREKCPSCSKPFQLYCSKCLQVTVAPSVKIPSFTLPLSVDYIFHRQESIRKSTGIHACVLAPRQCRIVAFPSQVPDYDPDSTVLLFPSPAAVYLDDPSLDFSTIKKVILIESTWQKANTVAAHPNFANLRHVRIRDRVSTFWRYQELGSQFLSTLEATFYLCVEAFEQMKKQQACAAELQPPKRDDGNAAEVRYEQKQNREQEQTQPQPESKNHYNHEFDNLMLFYAYSHYRVFQNYVSVAKGDHRAEAEEGKCGEQEDRNAGQKRLRFPKVWQTTDLTSSAPRK